MSVTFPSMAFALWPEADRATWLLNCEPPADPFDDPRYGATLRVTTQVMLIKAHGIWLAFLVSRNELDPSQPPLERVTRPRLRGYFRAMRAAGKADQTIISCFGHLAMAMKVLAPSQDVSWIRCPDGATIYSLLPKIPRPVFVPDRHVLRAWTYDLMNTAEQEQDPITYRDGLLMACLAARGRRLRSMTLLRVGHELIWRDGRYRIQLTADQVKTNKPDRFDLPEKLTPYMRHYLDVVRPQLLGTENHAALWVERDGQPLKARSIQNQIQVRTKKRFGTAFGPHRFRHAIATDAPEGPRMAARLLGISSAILEKHYDRAE